MGFGAGIYLRALANHYSEVVGTDLNHGMRVERWLEERLRNGPLSWTLWTQYYVAQSELAPV
jgi:hypothetical protein